MMFLSITTLGVVSGATKPIPFTYDTGVFNITDLSIKEGDYSTDIIGFIQNVDPFMNTIKGTSLKIEMYDRNNHLIDVTESGYSSLPSEFRPQEKYAFKIPIDKNNELDHLHIQILAQDWGTSHYTYPKENVSAVGNNSSHLPYMGIVGLSLTPDMSKQLALNQTKGFLLTSITKGSPAENADLRAGKTIKNYNGTEINTGGDIILKIDNKTVSKIDDIMTYVSQKQIGDKVNLAVFRDNGIREIGVILGQIPSQPVFAGQNDNLANQYFSIKIPDSWTYIESSTTPEAKTTGFGPGNSILLTPNEFSDILLNFDFQKYSEKIQEGRLSARFAQDTDYRIKNAPLESYVKYQIINYGIQNITSQQYTTVGKEKAVRITANEPIGYGDSKIVLYLVMHDKQPYDINYIASPKNYDKYLPEFEQMVKSFRFVGSPSDENGDNLTNTKTNFSGANVTEFTSDNNQEELYDDCLRVSGKSLCDFLFRK